MTWDINNFATLSRYHEGGTVTFEDDSKSKTIGIGSSPLIEKVILVEGLKSISQLCDRGFKVAFDDLSCNVLDRKQILVFFSIFVKIMFT